MDTFASLITEWFSVNKRPLPWRDVAGWYPVFLSEYLLQQTQVRQAIPYYLNIFARFPDISTLAAADEADIIRLWRGLGYYNRARNLLKAAQIIESGFNGQFPPYLKEALTLPGIGDYTAAAILSIAFNQPYPVVDGNVLRVVMRFMTWPEDIRQGQTKLKVRRFLQDIIPVEKPGDFNEALMELGATVCKPKNPSCIRCPLSGLCLAKKQDQTTVIPFKSPPPPKQKRFQLACIYRNSKGWLLAQRPATGLLPAMWEFPLRELGSLHELEHLAGGQRILKHSYSHIDLYYSYIIIHDSSDLPELKNYQQTAMLGTEELLDKAIHKAHLKIIEQLDLIYCFSAAENTKN